MPGILPSLETFAKGTLATVATLSTVGAGLLWYGQNYLIYPSAFPSGSRIEVDKPSNWGVAYEDLELKTSDNIILKCYLIPQQLRHDTPPGTTVDEFIASRPTVIMFHGNAGNLGHRLPLASVFWHKMRCNVLMLCYRGYGLSEGSPSEKGLRIDAQTALDYITSNPILKQTPIILYGQSIGGAVAIDLASRNPQKIEALVIENTFTSLPNLVPHTLPALGRFTFLCHQKWDSISKIPLIPATTPILLLSGARDQVIPKEHMRTLWEAVAKRGEKRKSNGSEYKAGLERAKYMEFQYGGHNDTCEQKGYWSAVADFIASLADTPQEKPSSGPRPF
ncbi:Alpha/Beta hydrolase protein [Crassisporium funariophilum]|nr:Alpha/Beta hydrolase protein [Crassisporium funariophilum]